LTRYQSAFLSVQTSIWPSILSLSLFSLLGNSALWLNSKHRSLDLILGLLLVTGVRLIWWKDFSRERILGYHTHKLEAGLRLAFVLFILSEVFLFVSFFWAFYDRTLSPTIDLGLTWPPKGITPLSTYSVPLLNTVILLARGVSITWCHHSVMSNLFSKSWVRLFTTIILGIYFLCMQIFEYVEAAFRISDGVYGSTFFLATGFHGMHVLVGTLFLLYVLILLTLRKITWAHHFRFEAAAWYWHFVDVVWLFLFLNVYWWGNLSC